MSILNLIVFISIFVFIIIVGISIAFENVYAQEEKSPLLQLLPTLNENNDGLIISEEICPPYCSPPPPIQELPQDEQSP